MASPEEITGQTWRIIDANLNRIGEGLRFLEEQARLLLNDVNLTQQLKTMRHELISSEWPFQQQLVQARDSDADVGAYLEVPGQEKPRELPILIVANARRVQESLRVIEELAKIPDVRAKLDSEKFKQARFNLYTIEQTLLSKLMRQDKIKRLRGLYVIIDMQVLGGRNPVDMAGQAIAGGARIIQLRDKISSKRELLPIAQQFRKLCAERDVFYIMNDYLDLALATDADGLHVGQDDLPIRIARKLLPMGKILGGSATTVEQATTMEAEGADYIAVGAIYPTSSKEAVKVVGLEMLRQVRKATTSTLIAIGGITENNVSEVIAAGADSVAVIRAVLDAEIPESAARIISAKYEVPNG